VHQRRSEGYLRKSVCMRVHARAHPSGTWRARQQTTSAMLVFTTAVPLRLFAGL